MTMTLDQLFLFGLLSCSTLWIANGLENGLRSTAGRSREDVIPYVDDENMSTPTGSVRHDDEGDQFYLLEHCHLTVFSYFWDNHEDYVQVNDSAQIKLVRPGGNPLQTLRDYTLGGAYSQTDRRKCFATLMSALPGHRLLIHFNNIHINTRFSIHRLPESIHVIDGLTKKRLTPRLGLYGNYSNEHGAPREMRVPDFASSGRSMYLSFEGVPSHSGFDAVITTFKDAVNGSCGEDYFLCNVSKMCIPAHLQCDGQVNCGGVDISDELQCYRMSDDFNYAQIQPDTHRIVIMIGSFVMVLIIAVLLVWFAIMGVKRIILKRNLRRLLRSMGQESRHNHPHPPDPDRIYMPPHAAMAMLSPPPCYSESPHNPEHPESGTTRSGRITSRHSHRSHLELPPPYWAENSHCSATDTDRLIARQNSEVSGASDHVDCGGGVVRVESVQNEINHARRGGNRNHRCNIPTPGAVMFTPPRNNLPLYTSHDDLPSYAAATATEVVEDGGSKGRKLKGGEEEQQLAKVHNLRTSGKEEEEGPEEQTEGQQEPKDQVSEMITQPVDL